jgi:CheY-like chemotaxis protein/predicted regulator of Ras-like GTPase activity (Roadblock/LC7/MglB family)
VLLKILQAGLKKYSDKFETVTATDGEEAIKVLKREPISLLVTDLQMPRIDGLSLLAYMNDHHPEVPCIVMTAHGTQQIKEKLQQDVLSFIEKPFEIDDLIQAILPALDRDDVPVGSINGISIASFMQMIEMEQKTCLLEVESPNDGKGYFYFEDGILYDSVYGNNKGLDAALRLIPLESAKIRFKNVAKSKRKFARRIEADLMSVIMEAMRLKDEEDDRTEEDFDMSSVSEELPESEDFDITDISAELPESEDFDVSNVAEELIESEDFDIADISAELPESEDFDVSSVSQELPESEDEDIDIADISEEFPEIEGFDLFETEKPASKPVSRTPKTKKPTPKPVARTLKPEEPTLKPEEPTLKPEEPTLKPEEAVQDELISKEIEPHKKPEKEPLLKTTRDGFGINLKSYLEELKDISGYKAAAIMNFTGEVLEKDSRDSEIDLAYLSAMFNEIFLSACKVCKKIGFEANREMSIITPKGIVLMRCSGAESKTHIHVIVILEPSGNQALMKLEMERMMPGLLKELV